MPGTHALLSPSSAHRWINCPGSVRLAQMCPEPPETEYASEGTDAHVLADIALRLRFLKEGQVISDEDLQKMEQVKNSPHYSEEMAEDAGIWADYVEEAYREYGPDAILLTEQTLHYDEYVPDGYGRADAVIIADGAISVFDFKYGKGVAVEAENNPQMRLYALGAYLRYNCIYGIKTIRATIVQPRIDRIRSEEYTAEELIDWAETVAAPAAGKALEGDGEIVCGSWCQFCPAKPICRVHAEHQLELARLDFQVPELLTDDEIADVLSRAPEFKRWLTDVEEYALREALAGKSYTGWKVVEGRSVRKWADELEVAKRLIASGYDEALLYERKLNGITAMEKLVGKKKMAAELADLIVKPQGKPVLVPETDPREPLRSSAAEDFSTEI
ncbi:MAG: DUF2800 domain-containing protein [Mogibacterium sp.]|nr:DUF2800 domain-containing protein [Mogibacterium sp.]